MEKMETYFSKNFEFHIFRNFGKITMKAMILRNPLAFCEIPIQFGKIVRRKIAELTENLQISTKVNRNFEKWCEGMQNSTDPPR